MDLYSRQKPKKSRKASSLSNGRTIIDLFEKWLILAKGFLTGKYRSKKDLNKSPRGSGIERYLDDRGMKIINALDVISTAHQVVPAVVALAWLLQRKGVSAAIASVTSVKQLAELAKVSSA
jgi:aryl-alcohol dehydrogenase-like predicted oxidoreductase